MNQLGYYGKAPQRGDFVRFNLPAAFIKVWDDWLQQLMISGEETFAADWPDLYHAAPAYRFALSAGIAGEAAWLGIVMPGQDKVGRRFPFCIALSLPAETSLLEAMQQQQAWYEDAEALVRDLIAGNMQFDNLQNLLQDILEKHPTPTQPAVVNAVAPSSGNCVSLLINQRHALEQHAACLSVLNASLTHTLGYFSVWQACEPANHCMLSGGLPDDSCALALFSQQWTNAQTSMLDVTAQMTVSSTLSSSEPSISNDDILSAADTNSDTVPYFDNSRFDTLLHERISPEESSQEDKSPTRQVREPIETQSIPSADDWEALDELATDEPEEVVLPKAEKLELDDDESTAAPWET